MFKKFALILFLSVLVKYNLCCDCDKSKRSKGNRTKAAIDGPGKRESETLDLDASVGIDDDGSSIPTKTYSPGLAHQTDTDRNFLKELCPYYKDNRNLNFKEMADVWEIVYYRSQSIVNCFKIHIRPVSEEKKIHYRENYGDFNGSVEWDKCNLEITSHESAPFKMFHFLYGSVNDSGVLQNIFFTEEDNNNYTVVTFQDQSPDQWMVSNYLLLMRDCSNGDIIIFTRVPYQPTTQEIKDALSNFYEDPNLGNWACEKHIFDDMDNQKYKTIS